MEGLDYWRLCDELTVVQAALLIVGCDPSLEETYVENAAPENRPYGYSAAVTAIKHAVLGGRLKATLRHDVWERGWDEEPGEGESWGSVSAMILERNNEEFQIARVRGQAIATRGVIYRVQPNWATTTVLVDDLRKWLSERGITSGFFFPTATNTPDYLDPGHPRYAPKLAAAVRAWQAVSDPKGRHPKQALDKWLREHAAEYGLTDEDGNPINQTIEDCSKVANWQPGGGAPKTPMPRAPTD